MLGMPTARAAQGLTKLTLQKHDFGPRHMTPEMPAGPLMLHVRQLALPSLMQGGLMACQICQSSPFPPTLDAVLGSAAVPSGSNQVLTLSKSAKASLNSATCSSVSCAASVML